jgi:hypothetical protein
MAEKREHIRFYLSLPMEFEVQIADSDETWVNRAVLKNLSQGGLYFECETAPQLKRGNVGEFIFTTVPPKFNFINSPIKTQALVKRIEPRVGGTSNFGVAVQFLSDPMSG